ncbi:MAG: GWxTD domain-containing protein [Flavobacteriales bacterium]|jgi:GWxTD domain-containing protein|nr:GWxTD domain-containing protein [Flavobacteriales bacterium]MBP7449463.1 GWxTD domain-containing protein [Flavobacteriales bacterium]
MTFWKRLPPLFVLTLFWGCTAQAPVAKRDNLTSMYGSNSGGIRLQARVHHADTATSLLYFKLPTRDLLYKSGGDGRAFKASARVQYQVLANWGSRQLLDSAGTIVEDMTSDPSLDQELIGTLSLRPGQPASYVIKVTATDLNRESSGVAYLRVQRTASTRQYFLPIDKNTNLPLFTDHVRPGRSLGVRCGSLAGRSLWVGHRIADLSLPAPVFSTSEPNPSSSVMDSTFSVHVGPDGSFDLELTSAGLYHFRTDSNALDGYTVVALDQSHPVIGSAADMLRPMRYITSVQEYDRLSKAPNVRQAVEQFWLDAAGDRERAREAIRIYFERVETANHHFTSDVEGWRTDRGMVHIIFGRPTSIQKSDLSESWIYGEENNLMSLVFTFVRRQGPYTENDLILERDPILKGAWYRNVESWRNGRVYQN